MSKFTFAVTAFLLSISFISMQAQSIKRDPSFGDQGTIYLKDAKFDYTTYALFQDPATEEMLNAGIYYDYDNDASGLFFSKTKSNGDLDATFATDGILRLSGEDYSFSRIIRIRQAADKSYLILLGNSDVYNADSTAIICFTSKGKIVSDFGNGGLLSSKKGLIRDFDILADAKVLALSTSVDTTNFNASNWFSRYTQLGILDGSYGTAGYQEFEKSLSEYVRMDKSAQAYVCSGHSLDIANLTYVPVLCKVSASGVQDKTFGEPAAVFGSATPSKSLAFPTNLQILKDGNFLLNGFTVDLDSSVVGSFITKLDKTGQTTTAFGQNGYLEFDDLFQGQLYALSAMELPNSQILVSNTESDDNDLLEMSFYLYDKNGVAVTKFGTKGNQRMKIDDQETTVFNAFISASGKIFAGGDVTNASDIYESQITKLLLNTVAVSDELSNIANLTVSPNPVSEKATISFELVESIPLSIDLYDMQGCKIQSFFNSQARAAGKQTEELNLSSAIIPGVYMLQISSGTHNLQTVKIVKI